MVTRELVDDLMLGAEQDFAELRVVKRQQGGFDLFGFDFVKLDVGDFFGRDVKFAGGQFAVLVGVDAVEKRGDKFADGLAIGLLLHIVVPRFAAIPGKARNLGSECAGKVGMDNL